MLPNSFQPKVHRHVLAKYPDLYWDLCQPTSGDILRMQSIQVADKHQLILLEIAMTFAGTNLRDVSGDLLLDGWDGDAFVLGVVAELPYELLLELWDAVGEFIPGWGPEK